LKPYPRRTLDPDEQRLGGAAQPADFQLEAIEGAILDLATVIIGHEFAARGPPVGAAGVRERTTRPACTGRHEIGRAAIDRYGEFPGREPRAIDDRFVITGEEPGRIAELADADRAK